MKNSLSSYFCFGVVLMAVVSGGCASTSSAGRDAVPSAPSEEIAEYRIGSGDMLNVFVWNHPELSVTVPVRPDGMISTPLAENTQAAGKTATQLARDMETALSEYVRSPKVNVIVTSFVGSMDQIRVVGQAVHAQSLPFRAHMTVLDVMIAVGGLGPFAAGNRAKIVRGAQGAQKEIPVRLNDLMNKGDIGVNVEMQPGDVLIIPESRF
jgi:polysaccharide export outer membrane protein